MKISKTIIFAFFISQCIAKSSIDLVQQNKVIQWSSNLVTNINNYSYLNADNVLLNNKVKFSNKLWKNYYKKFINSDNYKRIREYNIVVNSYSNGKPIAEKTGTNSWKVILPIKIIFRNEYYKIEQQRNYSLLVNAKNNSLELNNISYDVVKAASSNNIPIVPEACK